MYNEGYGVGIMGVGKYLPGKIIKSEDIEKKANLPSGEIEVKTNEEIVNIRPGDFVIFPKGLSCTWTVSKPVRKYYSFG